MRRIRGLGVFLGVIVVGLNAVLLYGDIFFFPEYALRCSYLLLFQIIGRFILLLYSMQTADARTGLAPHMEISTVSRKISVDFVATTVADVLLALSHFISTLVVSGKECPVWLLPPVVLTVYEQRSSSCPFWRTM